MLEIETLSAAQQAQMEVYRDKWIAIGLSTAPANRAAAEDGIRRAYAAAGLDAPKIVWCGSPLSQGLTRAIILDKKLIEDLGASVRDSVWDSVWDSVRASVRASVGASVRDSVGASGYGQHDANWLGFYAYFREVCDLTAQVAPLGGLIEHATAAGWYIPHRSLCWLQERPRFLARDERGRLHAPDRMAIQYPDGWGVYAWHGVRVPAVVIEQPESLTAPVVLQEQNAEIRRVMLERLGHDRFLLSLKARPVDRDPRYGDLYRVSQPGDEDLVLVRVVNATPEPDGERKRYVLRVPPTVRNAHEAVAWTFSVPVADYAPQIET